MFWFNFNELICAIPTFPYLFGSAPRCETGRGLSWWTEGEGPLPSPRTTRAPFKRLSCIRDHKISLWECLDRKIHPAACAARQILIFRFPVASLHGFSSRFEQRVAACYTIRLHRRSVPEKWFSYSSEVGGNGTGRGASCTVHQSISHHRMGSRQTSRESSESQRSVPRTLLHCESLPLSGHLES